MRRVVMLMVVACIAGCQGPTTPATDAPDIDPDGLPGAARLSIVWVTDLGTVFPARDVVAQDLDVDQVKLRMENLHAEVGISPGDPRTTEDELQLHWSSSDVPGTVVFDDAPAGLYTNVILKLDEGDGEDAFEIDGEVEIDGDIVDFQISDIDSLSISASCALDLPPGADMTMRVEIELRDAMVAVQYDLLPEEGGSGSRRLLRKGDPQMAAFRNALQTGFTVTVEPN